MHRLIRELAHDGMAVASSRTRWASPATSDRIAFLFDGQIVEEGTLDEVIGNPSDLQDQGLPRQR